MTTVEKIRETLSKQFDFLQERIVLPRPRRMHLECTPESLKEILLFAVKLLDFNFICAITGLDEGAKFGLIYHLANQEGIVLSIKIRIPREQPVMATVTGIFPSADIYERELIDLLGIQITGLTPGFKYPLPEDWPAGEYPLRKDWKGSQPEQTVPLPKGDTNAS